MSRELPPDPNSPLRKIDYQEKGWELVRNKGLFEERINQEHSNETLLRVSISDGVVPYEEDDEDLKRTAQDKTKHKLVLPGDLVYNKMRMWQGAFGVSQHRGIVSSAYIVLEPQEINPDFVSYVYNSDLFITEFGRRSYGLVDDQNSLRTRDFLDLWTPRPPELTQKKIVQYLNNNVSRIDSLIKKKVELTELLKEKRQALIGSLSNKAAEDADLVKLKYICDFLPGHAFSSDDFGNSTNSIRLLRGVNIGVGDTKWNEVEYWPQSKVPEYSKFQLNPGDIVLAMDRPWINDGLRIAQVTKSDCPSLLVQRVLRMRSHKETTQGYIQMMLESDRFRQYLEPDTTGVSVPHISKKQVADFELPLPDKSTQMKMVSQWKDFSQKEEKIKTRTESSVELLREKRQSLITKAVTGEIDLTT